MTTGFAVYVSTPRFVLSALLLILALGRTLGQTIEMYKATKQWQPNRYLKLFLTDGILYFILYVFLIRRRCFHFRIHVGSNYVNSNSPSFRTLFGHILFAIQVGSSAPEPAMILLTCLSYLYYGPVIPRFIISVRELYDRELCGRSQMTDTGFGEFSQPTTSRNEVVSAIAFADIAPEQDLEVNADDSESDAIPLEVIAGDTHKV